MRSQGLFTDIDRDLATMAVHPDHQRRGAGRLLAQWGINVAEQLNLSIYFEAIFEEVPLHEHVGFTRLSHETVTLLEEITDYPRGADVPLMVEMPLEAKGLHFEEWAQIGCPETYQT